MSDHTYNALETALRTHIADIGDGAMLTDWRIIAASVDPNRMDITGYTNIGSEHTPAHARLGLALVGYRDEKSDWDTQADEADDCD